MPENKDEIRGIDRFLPTQRALVMTEMLHFQLMAKYNARMNTQVYEAAITLPENVLNEDKGAFFKSINGTLNHILVGDLLWFSRFIVHSQCYKSLVKISAVAQPKSLNETLFSDIAQLYEVRKNVDALIVRWALNELEESDLNKGLAYTNAKGVSGCKPFRELLSHVFNHQTHHRGQVSTLLSQSGVDIGVTDFIMDIPDCL